jgi:sodium/potassium-transporting ATPase subunit alpha
VLYCKGAPEVVLARCTWAEMDGGGGELSADLAVTFRTAAEAMAEKGLRVLAFAWRKLPESFEPANAEAEMTLAGLIGLEDPPRPEVADALQKCRDAGIKVIMVTSDHPPHRDGDHPRDRTGTLRHARVITGEQLGHLSDIQLALWCLTPLLERKSYYFCDGKAKTTISIVILGCLLLYSSR